MESQLRRHRADVARRLHHPLAFPRQDQGSLRQQSEADEPAAGRLFPRRNQTLPERLAQRRRDGGQTGHSRAGVQHRARVLTTSIAAPCCRRTCCRRSAIISARTLTSAWTSRAANSSTPTGPAAAARPAAALTMCNSLRRATKIEGARLRLRVFSPPVCLTDDCTTAKLPHGKS